MFTDLRTFRRRAKQIVYQKTGLASESVHVDFNAQQGMHADSEKNLRDLKRALEGLREGLRTVSQATMSAASAFSSVYNKQDLDSGGMTKKFSDAVAQLEDRSRSRAEEILAEQLTNVDSMLGAMDLRTKFENRRALLLDLDSYKRKVADLKEKEQKNPGKVDQGLMRDKEEKLRVAERKFTDCNDALMEEMAQIQDQMPELLQKELLGSIQGVFEFFTGAAKAFSGMDELVAEAKKRAPVVRSDAADSGNGGFRAGSPRYAGDGAEATQQVTQQFASSSPFGGAAAASGGDPFSGGGAAGGPPSPMGASTGAGRRLASFDYAATEQGELTFTKGDYITVLTEDPSGWWQGRNERTGAVGVFPSNYTSPV